MHGTMPPCIDRMLQLPTLRAVCHRRLRVQAVLVFSRQHAAPEANKAASTAEAIHSAGTPCAAQQLVHACIADMQQRFQTQQADAVPVVRGEQGAAGASADTAATRQDLADLLDSSPSGVLKPELRLIHQLMVGKRMILWDVLLWCRSIHLIRTTWSWGVEQ